MDFITFFHHPLLGRHLRICLRLPSKSNLSSRVVVVLVVPLHSCLCWIEPARREEVTLLLRLGCCVPYFLWILFFILEVHNPINGRPTLRGVPKRPRSFSPRMCVCVSPLGPLGSPRALQETAKGWIIPTRNDRGNNGDDECP